MPDTIPTSPADGTHIFDDFHSNAAVTTGLLGSLDWLMTTVGGGASTPSYLASQNGVMRLTSDGTTARGLAVHLMPDKVTLGGGDGVFVRARIRLATTLTGNNFRFGFSASVTLTEPVVGVWIDCDSGLLSFDVASTNGDISKAVTGVKTLTSGTTMIVDVWHDLELRLSGTNANGGPDRIDCFVDGEFAGAIKNSLLGSAETMEFSIVAWDDAGTAQKFDIDYYEAYIPRV
ncbi:hypothetical protein LCGC14_1249150 [marine sediment metagenome]|uniref:Uncharacterized protein n=1 Tax=marine sediment metagenome TaxID=412755 RepID=A0A0F9P7J3_9ZZZZ